MTVIVKFGGLDVALRNDNSCFLGLTLQDGIFEERACVLFPHIDAAKIKDALLIIQRNERYHAIGYDRLGTGEMVNLFPKEIPLFPVVSSMPVKQDIIGLVRGLFFSDKLKIHTDSLMKEIMEQETYKSDAGNILYRHPAGFHDDRFWALGYACYIASSYIPGRPVYTASVAPKPFNIESDIDNMLKHI